MLTLVVLLVGCFALQDQRILHALVRERPSRRAELIKDGFNQVPNGLCLRDTGLQVGIHHIQPVFVHQPSNVSRHVVHFIHAGAALAVDKPIVFIRVSHGAAFQFGGRDGLCTRISTAVGSACFELRALLKSPANGKHFIDFEQDAL